MDKKEKEEVIILKQPVFEFAQQQTVQEKAYDMAKILGNNPNPEPNDGGDSNN